MANRPGIQVISRSAPTPRGIPTNSGTWFVVGTAQKGPTDAPRLIRSMNEFAKYFGVRSSTTGVYSLYDPLETAFREGLSQAYVVRVEGASSAAAAKTLVDASAGNSLKFTASSVGTWANSLTLDVVTGVTAGTFIIIVKLSGTEVDRSPELADVAAAMTWKSDYGSFSAPTSPSGLDPAPATNQALTGGLDDQAGVNDTLRQTALNVFTADLGPGQVSVPGVLTSGVRTALITHAKIYNRVALLDSTDSGSKSILVSEGQGLQADGNEYAAIFGPWVKIPGVLDPTTPRTVAPSGLAAGLIARNDALHGTQSPAAGDQGFAKFGIGVSQPPFTDADRTDLNDAGMNIIRVHNGQLKLYGYRSLGLRGGPWAALSVQRTRMALVADLAAVADSFVFAVLDGKGHTISDFGGRLAAVCENYRNRDALYGEKPDDAYTIDVSEAVNTPDTIAANELHALVSVRIAGFSELVTIEIVKIPNNQTLAA